MKIPIIAAALLLAAMPAAAKDKKPEHVYGPAPEWEQFRALAEANIRDRLIDPESARIEWLGQYHKGEFKPFLEKRVAGYIGCGTVNARNRMGGYVGRTNFVVVADFGRILFAEVGSKPGGMIAEQCTAAQRAGLLPPLSAIADSNEMSVGNPAAAPPSVDAATGLALRAMPDGAYISAVSSNSAAASAGLKPGMVITTVNAIPLAGMGDAMLKVVGAAGPDATLTMVGGTSVKLGERP
jgi:hypothetical protein